MFYLLFLIIPSLFVHTISAQEVTPTTTIGTTQVLGQQEVRDKVQKIVQDKLKAIIDTSEVTSDNNTTTNKKKGFIGKISSISGNTIVISYKDKNKTLTIDDTTTYVDAKRSKITLDKIKVDMDILAMGYSQKADTMDVKRILVIKMADVEPTTSYVIGQITDVSKSSSIFSLTSLSDKNIQYQIKTTDTKSLEKNQKVVVIIKNDPKNKTNTYTATKIVNLTVETTSTPAPSKKPSPTLKPTSKP